MQVILQRDVPNLGLVGEVVNVKPGFARNYLVPKGLALVADPKAVRQWEHAKQLTEHAKRKAAAEAQGRATVLNGVDLGTVDPKTEQDWFQPIRLSGAVVGGPVLVYAGQKLDNKILGFIPPWTGIFIVLTISFGSTL